jgi:hypothetical protein
MDVTGVMFVLLVGQYCGLEVEWQMEEGCRKVNSANIPPAALGANEREKEGEDDG